MDEVVGWRRVRPEAEEEEEGPFGRVEVTSVDELMAKEGEDAEEEEAQEEDAGSEKKRGGGKAEERLLKTVRWKLIVLIDVNERKRDRNVLQ